MASSRSGISRGEISRRIAAFAKPNSFKGYRAFALDLGGWALSIAAVLYVQPLAGKIAASLLAGLFMLNLGVLAHEAAHGCLVGSKRGNKVLAVICFTILMFNYRLWIYEHHVLHHNETNTKFGNSWWPLSPDEYKAKSWLGRALYRLYRSPTGLGIGVYYLIERWFGGHFYPGSWLPKRFRPSAWRYTASLALYATVAMGLLALAPYYSPTGSVTAVVLGFLVPFFFWITSFSLSVCLQHVSPKVPWYADAARTTQPVEELTVHVKMPRWASTFTHHAMEHPVHHINAMVPHYRLRQAQSELTALTGDRIDIGTYTPWNLARIMKRCKLYDYERHLWVGFDGKITAVPLVSKARPELEPGMDAASVEPFMLAGDPPDLGAYVRESAPNTETEAGERVS